jgi:hypothetical protein
MPPKKKNPAAVILGHLSGIKRGHKKTTNLTKAEIRLAAANLGQIGGLKGGRLGGLAGGRARADKLDAATRRSIASNAAKTRWANLK